MKYPKFTKLLTLKTHITTVSYCTPHNDMLETFKSYKNIISTMDIDIALLSCVHLLIHYCVI